MTAQRADRNTVIVEHGPELAQPGFALRHFQRTVCIAGIVPGRELDCVDIKFRQFFQEHLLQGQPT